MKLSTKTRSQMIAIILVMTVTTVGSAFAIVWMQQQISRTAQHTKQTEYKLAEMVRKLSFLDEKIATLHQPVVLQGKVAGKLRPSMENQVVWVREQERPNGRAYAINSPYEVSTDLAMLNLNSPR